MFRREVTVNTLLVLFFVGGTFYVFQPPALPVAAPVVIPVGEPIAAAPAAPAPVEPARKPRKPAAMIRELKESKPTLSQFQREVRLQHAQELLGKHYRHSVVRNGEKIQKVNKQIYRFTREHLPKKFRKQYKRVAQAIIDESLKNEFDPVFLVSIILGESSFNPNRLGSLDEIGLMQIRPSTAAWISKKYGMAWKGDNSLFDPAQNIRIGAAYLHYLREKFDSHAQLYLAAYNMGVRNVGQALDKNVWPKDYPIHVMRRYVDFYSALDSKQDSKL